MKKLLLLLSFLYFGLNILSAQTWSNIRNKTILIENTEFQIDTLSVIPSSFKIYHNNKTISDSLYEINFLKSQIILDKSFLFKTLNLSYRVYPVYFYKTYSNNKYDDYIKLKIHPYELSYQKRYNKKAIFKESEIITDGNISRGINFGNNQDLTVNSELNLKLQGKLNDKLKINAVITDNNIPFQADGYTQQIQEFDKVFVQLYNDNLSLTVGDIQLINYDSKYLKLNKKVQGLNFESLFKEDSKKYTYKFQASGAIAKGKYTRNTFQGIEGNQGPYLLNGEQNERYIIILSGTEKVYIDGKLLQRGEDHDYTIDYNRAEIIFTNNQPITKDKRISIEFEYSEKNYTRFITYTNNEFSTENTKLWLNFYSEKDAKNQQISYELSDMEKNILSFAGDQIDQTYSYRIDSVPFNNSEILYAKKDSAVLGLDYTIYQYSSNPDSAFYRLSFTYFGENKGNYVLLNQLSNGRVFKWVAPENGVPQGQYEPVVLIASPKSQQLLNIGAEQKLGKSLLKADFSLSNQDLNLYSNKDDDNNVGYSIDIDMNRKVQFKNKKHQLINQFHYSVLNSNFTSPERFRSVEFNRDWNILQTDSTKNEHLFHVLIEIKDTNNNYIRTAHDALYINDFFLGNKTFLQSKLETNKWNVNFDGSLLSTNDDFQNTQFIRNKLSSERKFKNLKIGLREELEFNKWKDKNTDTLISNSYSFYEFGGFVNFKDSLNRLFTLDYKYRQDYLPQKESFELYNKSHNANARLQLYQNKNQHIAFGLNYRNLTYTNQQTELNENTFLGRLDYKANFLKKGLRLNTVYELGSGMEAKKEYFFIEVSPGQGVYTWVDFNENGIAELDEFQVAEYQDEANYIRVVQVSKELEKVLSNKLNFTFYIKPSSFIKEKTGLKGFIRNFSNKLIIKTSNKNYPDSFIDNINPFILISSEQQTLNNDYLIRNIFNWKSTNRKYFIDLISSDNRTKVLLVNGIDFQKYKYTEVKLRYRINPNIRLSNSSSLGLKEFDSNYLVGKNYQLKIHKNILSSYFQFGRKWNFKTTYQVQKKDNLIGDELLFHHKIDNTFFITLGKKGKLSSTLAYVYNDFSSEANSSISYEMLEGLQNGHNGIITISFFKQVSKFVELNLNYSGRVSEEGRAIHNASMQLKAVF